VPGDRPETAENTVRNRCSGKDPTVVER